METQVLAPMVGKIVSIDIQVGNHVEEDQAIIVMEAMKMKLPIVSPASGTVKEIRVSVGQTVEADMVIAVIES